MGSKSIVAEGRQIHLASDLIHLGARLQVLESETTLSRERLLRLYKEIKQESPPKGMLPFSADWFLTWQPNIHASMFINIHRFLFSHAGTKGIESVVKAYKLYLEHLDVQQQEPVLSLTRAWTLVRYFNSNILQTAPCVQCGGHFVVQTYDLYDDYVCGLCRPPSRAGKTRKAMQEMIAA